MQKQHILGRIDHTLLRQDATLAQIEQVCKEAIEYSVASVCIPPFFVSNVASFTKGEIPICTVVGFPNGYQTTATKIFEATDAIKNGADEIDMVINLGWVKEGLYEEILQEINAVKKVCGYKVLKVIIETVLLTEDEKIRMCEVVSHSDADYIKTSTGFAGGGATLKDIELFSKYTFGNTKIKAAGGIKTIQDAEEFLQAGASRLGSSSLLGLLVK
ncbi:MAG: deoxyribose-phosphate aldolase [Anaerotignum sp.]